MVCVCVYVCAGGSGGAAHSSQWFVATAAEAERPEREGAATGSGEESAALSRPQWAVEQRKDIAWQWKREVLSYQNRAVLEAEIAHVCLLLVIYTHQLVVIWSETLNLFSPVLFLILGWSGWMRQAIFLFSRRRWSWSLSPTSRTTGWSSTRDCWMPSPCRCACRYSTEQRGHAETSENQTVLFLNFNLITGSRCGERVSQPVVQTVSSTLPAHPGSS